MTSRMRLWFLPGRVVRPGVGIAAGTRPRTGHRYRRWGASSILASVSPAAPVPIAVHDAASVESVVVDQASGGGRWIDLGTWSFDEG